MVWSVSQTPEENDMSPRSTAALTADLAQCATCGVEYAAAALPPTCPICADDRQWVPEDGQRWVRPADSTATIDLVEREPGLWGLVVDDGVGIGQQAKVVVTEQGCVMVDVPAAITDDAVRAVRELGPLRAIIPSHPHMLGLASAWSAALDDAPVCVAEADAGWLGVRPGSLRTWRGELRPVDGVVATQPGGHFAGSTVVHWRGADDRGVLLAGDSIMVNPDRVTTSFMRSYPNRLPLSGPVALRIAAHVARWEFDRLYSNFALRIDADARRAVLDSARRHAEWASGAHDDLTGGEADPVAPTGGPLRIVHHVPDLAAAERFWVAGLGLAVQFRKAAEGEPPLLMVAPAGASWHLELVESPDAAAPGTDDGMLVLHLGHEADEAWLARIEEHGGRRVRPRHPYWSDNGITVEAPSGHRVVLSNRTWSNG